MIKNTFYGFLWKCSLLLVCKAIPVLAFCREEIDVGRLHETAPQRNRLIAMIQLSPSVIACYVCFKDLRIFRVHFLII